MNKISNIFDTDICIENISKALGHDELKELPHYDTINNFLKVLDNSQLEEIRKCLKKEVLNITDIIKILENSDRCNRNVFF